MSYPQAVFKLGAAYSPIFEEKQKLKKQKKLIKKLRAQHLAAMSS
jgi:hypothetical protein